MLTAARSEVTKSAETVHVVEFDSPIGALQAASTEAGLAYVRLPRASGRGLAGWLKRHAPGARLRDAVGPNRAAQQQLLEYLEGEREAFDLPLDLRATAFQALVYEQVRQIPYGRTASYAELAEGLGRPNAVRAVGTANGANPLPLVVPCHRVVGKDGHLHGYAGGLPLKAKLLAMERSREPGDSLL